MIDIKSDKAISKVNYKKALIFLSRKKLFKPIYLGRTKSFTGYQTIAYLKSDGLMTLDVTFEIIKGSAWLAIIQGRNLYEITDKSGQKSFKIRLDPGKVRLRLIGDHADIKYKIHIH